MLKGCLVKIKKDIIADKYYHGYTTFPEGSLFTYEGLSDNGLKKVFSTVDVIEIEQPKRVFMDDNEFEVVEGCKTEMNPKEMLFKMLENIDKTKSSVSISRMLNHYPFIASKATLITTISVISEGFTACISSNDVCNFTVFDIEDVFNSKSYNVEYEGLYQEVLGFVKPLLEI